MLLIKKIFGRRVDRAARAERTTSEQAQFAEEQERKLTYARVFNTTDGQWVLADLAEQFHALGPSTVYGQDGNVDVPASFVADGRREVVMWILRFIDSPLRRMEEYSAPEELDPLED